MELLTILLIITTLSYAVLIIYFRAGLKKNPEISLTSEPFPGKVSVVIPFRNEEKNLEKLLKSLAGQEGLNGDVEFVLADDHSMDSSPDIISKYCKVDNRFLYLPPERDITGKKEVLKRALMRASGDWIIQMDADVCIGKHFLLSHLIFKKVFDPDLVSAPVLMSGEKNVFSRMEALEFLSLNASGAGSFGADHAVMCNGANIAYSRSLWLETMQTADGQSTPSGDDMFLMHRLKKERKKLLFLSDKSAVAGITPSGSLRNFLQQRIRWSSKSHYYRDSDTIATALIVYLCSLFFVISLGFTLAGYFNPFIITGIYLVKLIADYFLLAEYTKITGGERLLRYFLPLSVFHYFYIVIIPIISLLAPVRWKGRKY